MAIEIELYVTKKQLIAPFESAHGLIYDKEILQCIISSQYGEEFIYELPVSPRMGGSVISIVEFSKQNTKPKVVDNMHKMIIRALSYYYALSICKMSIPRFAGNSIKITTYPIGCDVKETAGCVSKLKGGPATLNKLVRFTIDSNHEWIIDFNASLDKKQWIWFCENANFKNCRYIEQPCDINILNEELASICPADIYADEEMSILTTPSKLLSSPYSGFVLKAIRHNALELLEWIIFGQIHNFPFMVSSMISDRIAQDFDALINASATYNISISKLCKYFISPLKIKNSTYKRQKNDSILINANSIKEVRDNYTLITIIKPDFCFENIFC